MKHLIKGLIAWLIIISIMLCTVACNIQDGTPGDQAGDSNSNDEKPNNPDDENNGGNENVNKPTEPDFEWSESDLVDESIYFDDSESSTLDKHLGRTQQLANGLAVDHVASGIEFRGAFVGEITLKLRCFARKDNEAYLAVFIDGVRVSDTYFGTKRAEGKFHVTSSDGEKELTIANFEEPGEHTIRIVKQTESNYSLLNFLVLTYKGMLAPAPAQKDLYIEFLGDSLTCAMGSAGDTTISGGGSAQGTNGADWEDGTFGYAYRTADMLDADYSIISESGIGLAHTWFGAKMGNFYTRTSYNRSSTEMYDFENARVPDLVVINLGTNDHFLKTASGHSQNYTDPNIVQKEAKALMETIRAAYGPNVKILWVSGVWTGIEYEETQVNNAIAELGGEAAGIYSMKLTYNAENNRGAEGHPSKAGHDGIMAQVYAYICDKELA
jgi:lysophospholipase L1-like esterase